MKWYFLLLLVAVKLQAECKRRHRHHHYHHRRVHAPPKALYTHYYIMYKYEQHHEDVNVKFTMLNNSITTCAANISDFLCYTNTNLICLTNGTLMCVSDINLIRSFGTDLPLGIFGTEEVIPEDYCDPGQTTYDYCAPCISYVTLPTKTGKTIEKCVIIFAKPRKLVSPAAATIMYLERLGNWLESAIIGGQVFKKEKLCTITKCIC